MDSFREVVLMKNTIEIGSFSKLQISLLEHSYVKISDKKLKRGKLDLIGSLD